MVGSLSARAIRARIHANTLFAALLFTLSNLACQDAPDLLRDADPPVAADPGDDTQFLTLDDEIEPAAAPPAASELRILAQKSPDAEGMGWEFLVTGADDNRSVADLRFVWDFGIPNQGPLEGAGQAVVFPNPGDYHVTVTVLAADGTELFELTLDIAVAAPGPVAQAGADVSAVEGERVCLDGSSGGANDRGRVSYRWTQIGGPAATLPPASLTGQELCFDAPEVDADAALVFLLAVSDGESSGEDTVVVNVANAIVAAGLVVADAGPDQTVTAGEAVTLDGRESYGSGAGSLTYAWRQTGGPTVTLSGAVTAVAAFVAPDVARTQRLTFALSVDEAGAVGVDETVITVEPQTAGDSGGGFGGGGSGGGQPPPPVDSCPTDPEKLEPGLCGCNTPDVDTDSDGMVDCLDDCPADADKVSPGICGCGVDENDRDGDGTPDCVDGCPDDPEKTGAGACGCGTPDEDTDGDGAVDCGDPCANSPDTDGDGAPDCADACPADAVKTNPGVCGCGVSDVDADEDGTPDCNDGCPTDAAKTAPGVCGCGLSDQDYDGDGTPNCHDGCVTDANKIAPGVCGCGVSDDDADNDGIVDCNDPCTGGPDSDGDGVRDCDEECPLDPLKTAPGVCGCGELDLDNDLDGTPNCHDGCPFDPYKTVPGVCGCGVVDDDTDGDGTADCHDGCPADAAKTIPAICGCGVADTDSDGDGVADCNEIPAGGLPLEDFQSAGCGADAPDWFDTAANNSMVGANLFAVHCLGSNRALGTTSNATNIHTHYAGEGSANWPAYAFTGRFMLENASAGIGVTFFSDYPHSDAYYRLRRGPWSGGHAFHLDGHPDGAAQLVGDIQTDVVPDVDTWYRFRVEVRDTGVRTEIQARVWPADTAEPANWAIDAYDANPNRLRFGTVGAWSMGPDGKYWDDLEVRVTGCDEDGDGDGTADCVDPCPSDPDKVLPGVCGCGAPDSDADADGVVDCVDPCHDGPDGDGDGTLDCEDECPADANKTSPGACGCGVADGDSDGDGVADCVDQCPGAADADSDGDTVPDCVDACPGRDDLADTDGDGIPNGCDEPVLAVSATAVTFAGLDSQANLEIWNAGGGLLGYTCTDDAAWLTLSGDWGVSSGEHDVFTLTADRAGLSNGTHTAQVTITPAVGAPVVVAVTLLVQPYGAVLTPIARWNVVPRQRIDAGETLQAGVVAFSKFGIREVRFHISGAGYSGPSPKLATAMTYNDRVDVWEYWVSIAADEFSQDGPITVEAVVVGNDGGIRDKTTTPGTGLEALTLFVNPQGTLPANTAWVATNGSDATGQVNDPTRPFQRISMAMQAIESHQGGHADGGIVRLRPGDHIADGGGIYGGATCRVVDEWITITHDPDAGGNQANTRINARQSGDLTAYWLKLAGLTLSAPNIVNGGNSNDLDRTKRSVWLKDCNITGGSGDFMFPVGSGWRGPHYYTECVIADQRRASGNGQNHRLMRNLTMLRTREDNFQSVPCGINIWVDGSDPGPGANPEHADVIQGPPALAPQAAFMHNWIWYNVVATDLHYQGIFVRSGGTSKNNAFVNCLLEMRDPVRNGTYGRGSSFAGKYDHLLFWHCSFVGTNTRNKFNIGQYESTTVPTNDFLLKNISIRGCLFERFRSTVSTGDRNWIHNADVDIRDNHYITLSDPGDFNMLFPDSAGGTKTTGDPQMVGDVADPYFAAPAGPNSPLVGRISPPIIPADVYGEAHGSSADVGAISGGY
jgi:hypothetical protein